MIFAGKLWKMPNPIFPLYLGTKNSQFVMSSGGEDDRQKLPKHELEHNPNKLMWSQKYSRNYWKFLKINIKGMQKVLPIFND